MKTGGKPLTVEGRLLLLLSVKRKENYGVALLSASLVHRLWGRDCI